jgi:hypothetical protein
MKQVGKYNVPLGGTVGMLHIIRNGRPPEPGNVKQTRKSIFERSLSTPNILPETDLGSNPWVESKVPLKITPPHANELSKPYPMQLSNITRAPTTLRRLILSHHNRSPPSTLLMSISP